MLLHIFDVVSFGNVDAAYCFEETEWDYGVDSAGHFVGERRAQANRRSNPLQAGRIAILRLVDTSEVRNLSELLVRTLAGAFAAASSALIARATRSLSNSGAVAAFVTGTICAAAGWSWAILLISLFIAATALSKLRRRRKARLIGSIVEKGGERDVWQVLANGGVYVASATGYLIHPDPLWFALGAGSLAAASADTWATEIGTLSARDPVSITSWRRVPPGTSGGITLIGTLGGIVGALFVAAGAWLLAWPVPFAAVALAGIAGALADSILGGTLQARRWCERCEKFTEREIHDCGTRTTRAGGVKGMNNDVVNAICSATGALVGLLVS
jgi:uncharacterized protein (TIGR00297 family)